MRQGFILLFFIVYMLTLFIAYCLIPTQIYSANYPKLSINR